MQVNDGLGIPFSHGYQAYFFPSFRLPVTHILGYISFIITSVLLKTLLCLFSYQEVNGYCTAEALSGWEALSSSACGCNTKHKQAVVKVLQVSWFLPWLLLVNLHLHRQQTERNSLWIVSTANIYFFLVTYENGKFFAFIISTLKKIIVQYSSIEPVQWPPSVLLAGRFVVK